MRIRNLAKSYNTEAIMSKKYMIQGCHLSGEIAYTIYTDDENQMKQEIVDGLSKGFIMQVGQLQK